VRSVWKKILWNNLVVLVMVMVMMFVVLRVVMMRVVVTSLWVALATTVSRSRERLKKLPWVPPETLMVVSYTV